MDARGNKIIHTRPKHKIPFHFIAIWSIMWDIWQKHRACVRQCAEYSIKRASMWLYFVEMLYAMVWMCTVNSLFLIDMSALSSVSSYYIGY